MANTPPEVAITVLSFTAFCVATILAISLNMPIMVAMDGLDATVLTAGASITAPGVEVSAPAEGLALLILYFDIEDHGTGIFDFLENEGAFASGLEDSTNTPIPATWYGGALTVY